MYRVFLCLVNIVFVVFADANVFSQEKKLQAVIGGGISRFFGPAGIGKFYSIGLNGKVGASYQFDPDLDFGIFATCNSFGIDAPTGMKIDGATFTSLELFGEAKFYLLQYDSQKVANFYLSVAAGLGHSSVSDFTITTTESEVFLGANESAFLLAMGMGFRFKGTSTMGFFAEFHWDLLHTDGDLADLPVTETKETQYGLLTVGIILLP